MSNTEATSKPLTDEQKAFIASFKDTHGQYELSDEVIIAFLHGSADYFIGYTQLADARNLWGDALHFARSNT